jgi:hypothetical protein
MAWVVGTSKRLLSSESSRESAEIEDNSGENEDAAFRCHMNFGAVHMNSTTNGYAACVIVNAAYESERKTPAMQHAAPGIVDTADANACNLPVNVRKIGAVHMISRRFHMNAAALLAFSYAALTFTQAALTIAQSALTLTEAAQRT